MGSFSGLASPYSIGVACWPAFVMSSSHKDHTCRRCRLVSRSRRPVESSMAASERVLILTGHRNAVFHVTSSPDDSLALTLSADVTAKIETLPLAAWGSLRSLCPVGLLLPSTTSIGEFLVGLDVRVPHLYLQRLLDRRLVETNRVWFLAAHM